MSKPESKPREEDPIEKIDRDRRELMALIDSLIKRIEEETRKIQSSMQKGSSK